MKKAIHFKSSRVRGSKAQEANIYFHGYSAGHNDKDREKLFKFMPASSENTTNIFGYWNSCHFTNFSKTSRSTITAASRINMYIGAMALIGDRIAHFRHSRSKAETIGKSLPQHLFSYLRKNHPNVTTINLIGHSLGGRLVLSALKNWPLADKYRPKINNVLILGGAVEIAPFEARKISAIVNGHVINAYSRSDKVLLLNLGEESIGRRPIKYFRNLNFNGFGHTDYWPAFPDVTKMTKPIWKRKRIRIYR